MERWTYEELCELYRIRGMPSQEAFAVWLQVSPRSIRRWLTNGDERPNMAMSRHIDARVRMAVRRRHPRLSASQVELMERRDLMKLLALGVAAPVGGMGMVWGAGPTHVSAAMLDALEDVTTALAATYRVAEPGALLGAVTGHLEEIRGLLLNAAMQPAQRARLEAIGADTAIFAGGVSLQAGRPAQADAFFGLAERLARESGSMGLVAQALEWQSHMYWFGSSRQVNYDARPRVALFEEAETLAARHAPPVVQMAISGELARIRARIGDAPGADQALARSWRALGQMQAGDATKGFGSTVGSYSGYGEATFELSRGVLEVRLTRDSAPDTLRHAFDISETKYYKALCLAQLAQACIAEDEPEEMCARLGESLPLVTCASGLVMCGVRRARLSMPPEWNSLSCVRELDEQLASLTN